MKHYHQSQEIPAMTARVARKAFPKGSAFITLRDELGKIYEDEDFAELFSDAGRRAQSPGMLALVMVMQYMEGLTDKQAANAVRARIDWKYALGLELEDAGFDESVLSKFRGRVVRGGVEERLLERILDVAREHDLLATEEQRTDATHVLAAVAQLNRLELVGETLRQALEAVAKADGEWLVTWLEADWVELYGERLTDYRLPREEKERRALALRIGEDGAYLVQRVHEERPELGELEAIKILEQVWAQQYKWEEEGLEWRPEKELPPPAERISNPFDPAARAARKRQTRWVGYKAHLTETCHPESPHLITQVATTDSNEADSDALPAIQQELAQKGMLPRKQWVDGGYITVDQLVDSRKGHQINLFGPVRANTSWQARDEEAFDRTHFTIDWEKQQVTCPAGYTCDRWREKEESSGRQAIQVRFPRDICAACSLRARCTTARTRGRCLSFRPRPYQEALDRRRRLQETEAFWQEYSRRSGIEGTVSQAVRCFHLRRARYRGPARVHLQHLLVAAALNLTRMVAWLGDPAHARPHQSRLKRLPLAA